MDGLFKNYVSVADISLVNHNIFSIPPRIGQNLHDYVGGLCMREIQVGVLT